MFSKALIRHGVEQNTVKGPYSSDEVVAKWKKGKICLLLVLFPFLLVLFYFFVSIPGHLLCRFFVFFFLLLLFKGRLFSSIHRRSRCPRRRERKRREKKSIDSLVRLDNYCALSGWCLNGTSYGLWCPSFFSTIIYYSRFSFHRLRPTSHYDYE